MTYSYKSIIFLSTSSIVLTGVSSLFLPTSTLPLDNFFYFLLLISEGEVDYNYKFFWAWWGDKPTFKEEYLQLFLNKVYSGPLFDGIFFLNETITNSYIRGNIFSFFFFFNFIKFFVLCLFIFIFIFYFKILNGIFNSLIRLYSFLKSTITVNLPFLSYSDSILIFFFFFSSVYLLEAHFFFIFFCQGSTDNLNYQFNFLLSSFFFIFFFKLLHNLHQQSVLFTFSSFNQSFLNFYSGSSFSILKKKNKFYLSMNSFSKNSFFMIPSFFFFFIVSTFFFLSTFLVWFLRFCIQFVRLLVLFIVHTVFEFIVISSDSYLSGVNSMNFFLFKSFFLFFFYFFGFLYLIVYLNLMFTLQVFIFYFFSEIFQSNFIFDLAAVSIANLKKF